MIAIFKSLRFRVETLTTNLGKGAKAPLKGMVGLLFALLCLSAVPVWAGEAGQVKENKARRIEQIYNQALKQYKASNDYETAWKAAHACFEWAEFATKDPDRARLAQEGISAARRAVQLNPKGASGYHYLAMNLGQLARTRKLSALKMVDEMEESFLKAAELEPKLDYGGPHRSVGLLYREAPGWPISVGNKGKARQHLQKAAELCPEFPENHIALLETYVKFGDYKAATNALPAAEKCLKEAPSKFSGREWEESWTDWKERWEQMKGKVLSSKVYQSSLRQQAAR